MATHVDSIATFVSSAEWYPNREQPGMPAWESAVWALAALVGRIPKVNAVVGRSTDPNESEVQVWTYLDSSDRADRSEVYGAEAEILLQYPDAFLDFNVVLHPGKLTNTDLERTVYYYRRENANH